MCVVITFSYVQETEKQTLGHKLLSRYNLRIMHIQITCIFPNYVHKSEHLQSFKGISIKTVGFTHTRDPTNLHFPLNARKKTILKLQKKGDTDNLKITSKHGQNICKVSKERNETVRGVPTVHLLSLSKYPKND